MLARKKPLVARAEVPEEVLARLSREHMQELTPDYYYDGLYFRDRDAKLYVHHPDIEAFVQDYLAEVNQAIAADNARVEAEWQEYVSALSQLG